jgi:hypothetical protein
MQLSEWLSTKGISEKEFAGRINRDRTTVFRIARGLVEPNRDTREAIIRETGGAVTAADLLTNGAGPTQTSRKNGRRNGG